MKDLWSPWRMEYILQKKPDGCIFCMKCRENLDQENLILFRGEHNFVSRTVILITRSLDGAALPAHQHAQRSDLEEQVDDAIAEHEH